LIHIITEDNRRIFHDALTQMYQQRKTLFVDQMKWPLETWADLEIDQFDRPGAIYLVETEASGRVLQSARLLPSTGPHLLSEVFSPLCAGEPPRGPNIFEASRFCPAPFVKKGEPRRRLLFRMIDAILETGLLFGIEQVSFVASAALAPLALNAGWDVVKLGPSMRMGRDRLSAMMADVSCVGLARVRMRNAITGPLTRFADAGLQRAA
jgi:N-acyl-L-homoserine lactone synthetase